MSERTSVGRPPTGDLSHDLRIALDGVSFWAHISVAMGGSLWQVVRVVKAARPFVQQLARAGVTRTRAHGSHERAVARQLLTEAIHPVVEPRPRTRRRCTSWFRHSTRTVRLEARLRALAGANVLVIDEGHA